MSAPRSALAVGTLGALLLFALRAATLPPWAALGLLPLSLGVALLVTEEAGVVGLALGALGALAHSLFVSSLPVLAGALLAAAVLSPRAARARSWKTRALVLSLAAAGGSIASSVALAYASSGFVELMAVWLVASTLAGAALLIPVDDAMASALSLAAAKCQGPARGEILRALSLRRRVLDGASGVEAAMARRLEAGWRSILAVAWVRPTASDGPAKHLDARMRVHVDALERVYAAAADRSARVSGLADPGLVIVGLEGDALELEIAALDECIRATP